MPLRAGPIAALAALCLIGLAGCACGPSAEPPPPAPSFAPPPPPPPPAPAFAPLPSPPLAPAALPPGLLAAPPADAGPGECFAKVVVPGQPVPRPPPQPHAVWILTPAPPGGEPMWCLYFEPGVSPPPLFTPERQGWIRVICDDQATRSEIRHVQRRLHAWGLYEGRFEGRVDRPTLSAVRAFQQRRRIDHGGYLSLETLKALDEEPRGYPAPAAPPPWLTAPPPTYPAPACGPQPCAYPPPPRDLGAPPYSRWLGWSGKSVY